LEADQSRESRLTVGTATVPLLAPRSLSGASGPFSGIWAGLFRSGCCFPTGVAWSGAESSGYYRLLRKVYAGNV